jgi:hypothetical protein
MASWDTFLFGIPLVALLVFGFFRLDQVFTARKKHSAPTRQPSPVVHPPVIHKDETTMLKDPDGRLWDKPAPPKT